MTCGALGVRFRGLSQRANDEFLLQGGAGSFLFENFFRGKRNGVFVDAGTLNGSGQPHEFFERFMDWRAARAALRSS